MDYKNSYILKMPEELSLELAGKLRALRLTRGWRQETLAVRSGVSLGSLRRFERTGQISLKHLLELCFTLGRMDDFEGILRLPPATSIAELEKMSGGRTPKRGRQ